MEDPQATVKPLFTRLIVFTVPRKRKMANGLYQPNSKRGTFSQCQEAWVISQGKDVQHDFRVGQKVYVADAFELEPTNLDLWDAFSDDARFQELRSYVESVEGDVEAQIVMEDSILAIEE